MKLTKQMATSFMHVGIRQRIHDLQEEMDELLHLLKKKTVRGPYTKKKKKRYTTAQRQAISERMKQMWMRKSKGQRQRQAKLMLAAKNGKRTA